MIQLLFICHLTDCGFHIAPKWVDQKNVLLSSCQLLRKPVWTWFFWSRKCTDINLTVHLPRKPVLPLYYHRRPWYAAICRVTEIFARDVRTYMIVSNRQNVALCRLVWLWRRGKGQWSKFCLCATATVPKGLAGLAQIAAKRFKTRQGKRKLLLFYYCW